MPENPKEDNPLRALLIDIDNCPQQLDLLPNSLGCFNRIVICYGSQEPKLPLGMATLLAEPICNGRLEIVGMKKKGKNAADFGMTFLAGRLMMEMPIETEFILLSKDGDLDHAVNMLQDSGRKAERLSNTKIQPQEDGLAQCDGSSVKLLAEQYMVRYLKPTTPRPNRKKTLLNSIRSYLKGHSNISPTITANDVLNYLEEADLVVFSGSSKVTYELAVPATQRVPDDFPTTEFDDDIPF